jgi:serpin B
MNHLNPTSKLAARVFAALLTLGPTVPHAPAAPDPAAIARANNAFAADLYGQLKAGDGNLCFSPYSISLAFSMAWCGTAGGTAQQLGRALHLEGPASEAAAGQGALQSLLNGIQAGGDVQLAIANSLWPEQSYPFRPDYLASVREHFQVSVTPCDFQGQSDTERHRINRWVEDHTRGKIKDLLPEGSVTPMTRMVLANAVYFKGDWERQFQPSATTTQSFFLASGAKVRTPLMTQKASFRYAEPPGLQVLSLPYAGRELSMVVLLPGTNGAVAGLERELTAGQLEVWTRELRTAEVTVHLPRFKVQSSFSLNGTMATLGVKDAFVPGRADFSGMTERNDLFISDAVHKAFIEVNEEGTEAAAATALGLRATSMQPRPVVFRADHPFLYLIRHDATGAILFFGRVMDPTT